MADDHPAQLLAVEARLAKDPENEELLAMKADLIEIIELESSMKEEEEEQSKLKQQQYQTTSNNQHNQTTDANASHNQPSSSGVGGRKTVTNDEVAGEKPRTSGEHHLVQGNLVPSADGDDKYTDKSDMKGFQRRPLTEAELMAKRKEKNRKKKEKLREKYKEQQDTAESVKQSWQTFNNQRGLKGLTKRSIFASPSSVTGKVGVGTNGIADVAPTKGAQFPPPNPAAARSSAPNSSKRRY